MADERVGLDVGLVIRHRQADDCGGDGNPRGKLSMTQTSGGGPSEWTSERMLEWMFEWTKEWTKEWMATNIETE